MSDLLPLLTGPAVWLASPGPHDGIVVSTRIRLARNCQGFAFRRKLSKQRQRELVDHLMSAVSLLPALLSATHVRLDELDEVGRQALVERQLVSRELANGKHPAGVSVSADQVVSVMANEEDHLRLQVINAGLCVAANLEKAVAIDRELEANLGWAWHERFGYLTACPTNVGTGMRASVMLHLPALAETGELKVALRGLAKLHMTVRGLHGEGSEPTGHYFQVSNQRSLGLTEQAIAEQITETVQRLVTYEQLARQSLFERSRWRLEDKVFRAWGILTHARSLTSEELANEQSWIRLGAATGVLEWRNWQVLDRLFLSCQPAHLQLLHADAEDAMSRDRLRADLVRRAFTAPASDHN